MNATRENILLAALHLFAQKGCEAVSVSEIAGALGMTKGALYRHYRSKGDILDCIVSRMSQLDAARARQYELPEGAMSEMDSRYRSADLNQLIAFSRAQLQYWTREDFPSSFRKMLTLEQHRSHKMQTLYQQYLVSGPLGYVTDLLSARYGKKAEEKAWEFYAPMFLYYGLYDGAADDPEGVSAMDDAIERHFARWEALA